MQKLIVVLLLVTTMLGCSGNKNPDVSAIEVDLTITRFEQDFFALDTNNINVDLQQMHQKYPDFLQDYLFNILALPAPTDSNTAVENGVRSFIQSYKPLQDSAAVTFRHFTPIAKEIETGLKHVKHYFPEYKIPKKIITFIGPINSFGNIITSNSIAVGLQMYMGRNYSLYQSEAGQQLYPLYISRRFEPAYIAANAMKNIISDMYPENSAGKPLIAQMVEAGKRLYVLDKLLPETADTIKTGYTASQLSGSLENEALIWSFFLQNDLLFNSDPAITKDYMNDGPKTAVLGEGSPGFIGQFVGWQIVSKWMKANGKISVVQLMATDDMKIFNEAKYKPK